MNRNNMSKKQRRDTEAKGYGHRYSAAYKADSYAKNDEACKVQGYDANVAHRSSGSASYVVDAGRSMRNFLKITGVKTHA